MNRQDESTGQGYAERTYRSPASLVSGVLLLLLALWLGIDALVNGVAHTRLLALAGLVFLVPLVTAYTLRPVVRAGEDRLTVRNPFRTVVLPWGAVEDLRAAFSSEVFTADGKYQLWSIPVSLRQRKRANRQAARRSAGAGGGRSPFGSAPGPAATDDGPPRATADRALDELRELRESHGSRESAQGPVQVRWAWEIIAPCVVGAVALVVLFAV
ncbi:PH domain-containing protein [Streptomyces sp. NPDC059740]|uniref:PH domain-containing protein n=1 Tax=Streptomyces sp. NPDC059740 TaxID=3346926 RepID=UPI003662D2DB